MLTGMRFVMNGEIWYFIFLWYPDGLDDNLMCLRQTKFGFERLKWCFEGILPKQPLKRLKIEIYEMYSYFWNQYVKIDWKPKGWWNFILTNTTIVAKIPFVVNAINTMTTMKNTITINAIIAMNIVLIAIIVITMRIVIIVKIVKIANNIITILVVKIAMIVIDVIATSTIYVAIIVETSNIVIIVTIDNTTNAT